jgi:Fe-S oxidoreductase
LISDLVNRNFALLNLRERRFDLAYHNPCHLKIQPHPDSSLRMLSRIGGVRVEELDSHCCGMAGTWGFRADHYDLSERIAVDLIVKLQRSSASMGVTDCPTCRLQMEQFGSKEIRHPIEILADCLQT